MKKCHVDCATPCKVAACTDKTVEMRAKSVLQLKYEMSFCYATPFTSMKQIRRLKQMEAYNVSERVICSLSENIKPSQKIPQSGICLV